MRLSGLAFNFKINSVMAIIAIPEATTLCDKGGLLHSYGTEIANISAVTIGANGEVTAFTMTGSGQWSKLVYDDGDDVAIYTETGAESGAGSVVNQSATFEFRGITQAKIEAANNAVDCCGSVWVHVFKNGTRKVQGIQVAPDNSYKFSKSRPKVIASSDSGTGTGKSVLTYNIVSTADYLSPTTTVTDTAIEAL